MIKFNTKLYIGAILLSLTMASCSDILEEEPRGIYTPNDFYTEKGIEQGITALYRQMRNMYGNGYWLSALINGTDEATWAQSADNNFLTLDMSSSGVLTPTNYPTSIVWQNAFTYINTANGIIQNGSAAGVAESVVAEARFFRAFDYFLLVQSYGGVPLDLGSGELAFNVTPITKSVRNTVPDVYTKAIFPDLVKAIEDLPVSPRVTGGVTKNVARLQLAKAYLTYGWWLQNPNSIPTYPEANRVDPNGQTPNWYFQQAYNIAMDGINNPGPYGLLSNYYDVNVGSNDRNKESMLYADHTQNSAYYNEGDPNGWPASWAPENFAAWMVTWNYTNIRSSSSNTAWNPVSSVQRAATQSLGRPWTRMAPTIEAITKTFADKTHDSRYDGTFVTSYRGNWDKAGMSNAVLYNANNMEVKPDDAILTFLDDDSELSNITYPSNAGKSNVGAGEMPGRADFVVTPSGISRIVYPGLWKIGTYRTDNANGLGQPNAALTRPYVALKYSEFYFVAAEAAVKGATGSMSARDLINVIRERAGKWKFDNQANQAKVADYSAEMIAATPATITIDYILAERSREYYGEGYRWFDLVRTQKWHEIAKTYSIAGTGYGDHNAKTVTRDIQPHHYLRPIPQDQFDKMEMSAEELKAYQNPGY